MSWCPERLVWPCSSIRPIPATETTLRGAELAARGTGLQLQVFNASTSGEIDAAERLRLRYRSRNAGDHGVVLRMVSTDWQGGQAPIPSASAYASALDRIQACERWSRHTVARALSRESGQPWAGVVSRGR